MLLAASALELDADRLGPQTERQPQSSSMPGFWIVEGFATFVQDDVMAKLAARNGARPGDRSCAFVARAARAHEAHVAMRRLLESSRAGFQSLDRAPAFGLAPIAGDSRMILRPSQVNVFYEQSAALAWFLNYKAGPQQRSRRAEYVRAQYVGALGAQGWKALGYDEPEKLDQLFAEFLNHSQ